MTECLRLMNHVGVKIMLQMLLAERLAEKIEQDSCVSSWVWT